MSTSLNYYSVDSLKVEIYTTKEIMAHSAAKFVKEKLKGAIAARGVAHLILATGTSQFALLEQLRQDKEIEWRKIIVFHLDEYLGISVEHPASFRKYLAERILNEVKPKEVHYLNGDSPDIDSVIKEYSDLLKSHPVDIACIGIGENGHIAFNDPPVADFNDPYLVKIVELDEPCRNQQYGEGWFKSFNDVPTHALSLTIPAIMNTKAICCFVPDERKSEAVFNTLNGDISTNCPASILRKHSNCILYLDEGAASKL